MGKCGLELIIKNVDNDISIQLLDKKGELHLINLIRKTRLKHSLQNFHIPIEEIKDLRRKWWKLKKT